MLRRCAPLVVVALALVLVACGAPAAGQGQSQAGAAPVATGAAVPYPPPPLVPPTSTPAPAPTARPPATPTAPPPATATPQAAAQAASATPPASCPVTRPPDPPFVPPSPPVLHAGNFWYGTPALWTQLRRDGVYISPMDFWKIFWWHEGYDWRTEQQPALTVTARQLDGPAPTATAGRATNAGGADIGSAMLNGIDLPTSGCWAFTAHYGGTDLQFVIWLDP
ncbi:MAG TPA: hypothetical protein VFW96_27155 [Thermomicrobiales bacterium]|nr:hypothetical protein [Thermomicrobiales bacterium]